MTKISIINPPYLSMQVNGKNLVGYFAEQGQDEAVNQLLAHGGKLEDAIYGYAIAGNKRQIDHILKSAPASKMAACIGKAIRGYARGGHFTHIHAIDGYRDYKADLVAGLAEAGDKRQVTAILDRDIHFFDKAVEGYATCNQGELLTKLIKGTKYYPLAIYHAARSGHKDLVNDLLKQCGIESDYRVNYAPNGDPVLASRKEINAYSMLNRALQGYTAGRHFNEAANLLERGGSIVQGMTELKDPDGSPNHEMYLALLAHVKSPKKRDDILKKMIPQGHVMDSLTLTPSEIEQLEKIAKHMDDFAINYIEARHEVEHEAADATVEGEVTLPYLAKVIGSELMEEDCGPAPDDVRCKL